MNKKIRFTFVLIILLLFSSMTVSAKDGSEAINIVYRNIKVFLNNKELEIDEPFIYKGSTYIPIRTVAEAMNSLVLWNPDENKISISNFRDIPEVDYLAGEMFLYGEIIKPVDIVNRTIYIEQHFDDNSIEVNPNLHLADDAVIILQRNDKKFNIEFEDIRVGDMAGMVLNKEGKVRGIIIE